MRDPLLNPFTDDIFDPSAPDFSKGDVEWIHLPALIKLKHAASEISQTAKVRKFGPGRVSLISAPRAGYGKSHLIARVNELLGENHLDLSLHFDPDGEDGGIQWKALLESVVEDLHQRQEAGGDCTALDGIGRRVFAEATRHMISESRIPCADPKEAIAALDRDPIGLFDFKDKDQVVGAWFSQYFDQLLPTASELLAKSCGISIDKAKAWTTRFFSYTSHPENSDRLDAFMVSLPQGDEKAARQSLHEFLRLTSTPRPCVIVVDDLDGFYRDKDAGQKLAHLLLEVAKMSPNILLIISANEDLWEASFGVHIASAYEDRLTSRRIRLPGLNITRAQQLVRDRLLRAEHSSGDADEFIDYLALEEFFASPGSSLPYSPRAILRHAASIWERYCAGEPAPTKSRETASTKEQESSQLAPIPTPLEVGSEQKSGDPAESTPDIVFAEPTDDLCPTGSEIFDELTRDNINDAAKGLLDTDSVTKAPNLPPKADSDLLDDLTGDDDEDEVQSLGVTGFKDDESSKDELRELIGRVQPTAPESGSNGISDKPEDTTPKPLPSRSSDEDNPFNKLKRMLSKLRSEREEQRTGEAETLVGAELKRIESEEQAASASRTSATTAVTTPSPSRVSAQQDPAVLKEFRKERDLILHPGTSIPIIQNAICALAKAAGDRFPVVTLDEPKIADDSTAVRWSFEDNEILFGNQPGRDSIYWKKLSTFASDRSKNDKKIKMIVFSAAEDPVDVDTILQGKDDLIGIVDFTVLDRDSLASLYAAHRLIEDKAISGSVSSEEGGKDILGKLAGELDFFWKRITRPLPAIAKS